MNPTTQTLQTVATLIAYGHMFQDLMLYTDQYFTIAFDDPNHKKIVKDMYPHACVISITKFEDDDFKIKVLIDDADKKRKFMINPSVENIAKQISETIFDPRFENFQYYEEIDLEPLVEPEVYPTFVYQQQKQILQIIQELSQILVPQSLTNFWALTKTLPKDVVKEMFHAQEQKTLIALENYLGHKGIERNSPLYHLILYTLRPLLRTR